VTAGATSPSGAIVSYVPPTAKDDVDASVVVSCTPAPRAEFLIGTTLVTCTASDQAGNAAVPVTFRVTVVDTSPPVIEAAQDVVVDASSPAGAVVSYSVPNASDPNDGSVPVTCLPEPGSLFPIGVATVTCTADDGHGNSATPVSFAVHVRGAAEQLGDLRALVQGIGLGASLEAKVAAAQALVEQGLPADACDVLGDVLDETSAQTGKKLSTAEAAAITDASVRIRSVLSC
jgi:hypothetical protein